MSVSCNGTLDAWMNLQQLDRLNNSTSLSGAWGLISLLAQAQTGFRKKGYSLDETEPFPNHHGDGPYLARIQAV